MMPVVDVMMSGAVGLGPDIACDGFLRDKAARVQTHVHTDHLNDFESSKGVQLIISSRATKALLCLERNADLPFRKNFMALDEDVPVEIASSEVVLVSSGHMLGAVQVAVQLEHGPRVGYSGDFQWPLEGVIQVEQLVVDSTYGSPSNIREFSQGEVEDEFVTLVRHRLSRGPVHIFASRGTLQRSLQLLSGDVECPLLGTRRLCAEAGTYRDFGYPIGTLVDIDSPGGKEAMRSERFVRFYGTGDQKPAAVRDGTVVKLSAYFSRADQPVIEYSDRCFGVALSNHADFEGTLAYVEATGADVVVTDNTRGGKGIELAMEIERRLGVAAMPSSNEYHREWGR